MPVSVKDVRQQLSNEEDNTANQFPKVELISSVDSSIQTVERHAKRFAPSVEWLREELKNRRAEVEQLKAQYHEMINTIPPLPYNMCIASSYIARVLNGECAIRMREMVCCRTTRTDIDVWLLACDESHDDKYVKHNESIINIGKQITVLRNTPVIAGILKFNVVLQKNSVFNNKNEPISQLTQADILNLNSVGGTFHKSMNAVNYYMNGDHCNYQIISSPARSPVELINRFDYQHTRAYVNHEGLNLSKFTAYSIFNKYLIPTERLFQIISDLDNSRPTYHNAQIIHRMKKFVDDGWCIDMLDKTILINSQIPSDYFANTFRLKSNVVGDSGTVTV